MRKMMLNRGAKDEELEWSAFDKNFRNKDQVFKSDIIDYLEKNAAIICFKKPPKQPKAF